MVVKADLASAGNGFLLVLVAAVPALLSALVFTLPFAAAALALFFFLV